LSGTAASMPLPSRLSPSALNRYRICPKQFLLCDIERRARVEPHSPVLAVANAVHEALYLFFGLPLEYRLLPNLERCLRGVWRKHRGHAFETRDAEAAAGHEALQMLCRFTECFDVTAEPVARERWVGVRALGRSLYGKIDRADRLDDGLDLIDYKTGRRAIEPFDLRHDSAVQVYVLGAEATYKLPVRRVRLIYLALGEEVVWELERDDVESLKRRLGETLKSLVSEETFEARPGDACRFCPVQLDCPDKDRVDIREVDSLAEQAEVPF
jgi:putative RecB family exonuclease